jgi:hypothetical protein
MPRNGLLAAACLACLAALSSCGSEFGAAKLPGYADSAYANLRSVVDGAYISFMDDDVHLASFAFTGSSKLADYQGQESVLTPTKKLAYEFIDLKGGVLLARERGSSGPTPVRAVDLARRRDLLGKGFYSVAKRSQENERDVLLKKAGDRLNKDQQALLKMPVEEMEEFAADAFKAGLAVEFYEKYAFDFRTGKPARMMVISPVLYRRNILY